MKKIKKLAPKHYGAQTLRRPIGGAQTASPKRQRPNGGAQLTVSLPTHTPPPLSRYFADLSSVCRCYLKIFIPPQFYSFNRFSFLNTHSSSVVKKIVKKQWWELCHFQINMDSGNFATSIRFAIAQQKSEVFHIFISLSYLFIYPKYIFYYLTSFYHKFFFLLRFPNLSFHLLLASSTLPTNRQTHFAFIFINFTIIGAEIWKSFQFQILPFCH